MPILVTPHSGLNDSSAGKKFACNSGDPSSIPGSGRSAGEGLGYPLWYYWVSLVVQLVKSPPAMCWSLGSIRGFGRAPGEGTIYPLQCSGLENSMDCRNKFDMTEQLSLSLNSCPLEPQNESLCGNQVFAEIVSWGDFISYFRLCWVLGVAAWGIFRSSAWRSRCGTWA